MTALGRRPLAAASAGVFVVIGLAARAPLFGARSASASAPSSQVGAVSAAAVAAIAVLLTGWLAMIRAPRDPAGTRPAPSKMSRRARAVVIGLAVLVVAMVALSLVWAGRWSPVNGGGGAAHRIVQRGPGQRAPAARPATRTPAARSSHVPPVIVVASVAAVVGAFTWLGALVVVRRRRVRPATSDDGDDGRDALAQIAATAEVRLEHMEDVRKTIINAYAAMSAELGAMGLARRDPEGPREHLSRVLPALGAGGTPAERLERIFELARFTTRPLGPDLRTDAIAALAGLRTALGSRAS